MDKKDMARFLNSYFIKIGRDRLLRLGMGSSQTTISSIFAISKNKNSKVPPINQPKF
jgi:hypothetical protein